MATHYTTEELSAYLDGEYTDSSAVEQHLQSCSACADQHRSLADLSTQMRAIPDPEVTHGFAQRVMRACEEPVQVSFRPRFRFLTPMIAAAAALAAGVFGYVSLTASDFDAMDFQAMQQNVVLEDAELIIAQVDERPSQAVPSEYASRDYSESLVSLDEDEKDTLMMLLATSLIDDQQI